MSGPIPDGAPRWVTAAKDGHLPPYITRWLALPPVSVAFSTASATWSSPHTFPYIPSVVTYNSAGKEIEGVITATTTNVTVTFSEPLTGSMVLR